jgi:hypothetical protein
MKISSKLWISLLLYSIVFFASESAFAGTNTGRITTYHLDSSVAGRDACKIESYFIRF